MVKLEQPEANAEPVMRAESLSKVFPNGCRALDAVSLTVASRDMIVILGRSGAGKSTLVRSINRLVQPTSGRLVFEGVDVTHLYGGRLRQLRCRIGMIFQQFNLVSRLSVLENVLCGRLRHVSFPIGMALAMVRRFPRREKDLAFECLRQVGIEHLALQRADHLSGGQQQRVAIARTLAQEPHLILSDEPIASLDPHSSQTVMDILRRINEERHIPVIVNLHQVEFAREYGQRIVGMSEGRIVWDGGADELDDEALLSIYGAAKRSDKVRRRPCDDEPVPEPVPVLEKEMLLSAEVG
jgi:phosphonate transport system ATP-binding protein